MSAFDDEFGLFGDEHPPFEEDERRSTLGARIIATGSEIVIDEIEPEDEERPRRSNGQLTPAAPGARPWSPPRRRVHEDRRPADSSALRERAIDLLGFLAQGLVTRPEIIAVQAHDDSRQGLVLELQVATEDLGKVIGRGGRVAQALRTVVRAGVEGRVAIEIIDVNANAAQSGEVALTVNDLTEAALQASDAAQSPELLIEDVIPPESTQSESAPPPKRRGRPPKTSSAKPVAGTAPAKAAAAPQARRPRKAQS